MVREEGIIEGAIRDQLKRVHKKIENFTKDFNKTYES